MMVSDNIIMHCISLRMTCQTTSAAASKPASQQQQSCRRTWGGYALSLKLSKWNVTAVVWRPDAEGAEWGCRRSASGLSLCINVRLRTLARSTGVKEPRGKSGEKVQGAREERVNPEASAATAHNWEAGLRTGNMMKDDDKKSASTREDVYVQKKNTKMKWHDVFSDRQHYKFERKLYLRYINSSGGSSSTCILHVFILL